jgi:hypothetical protein
MQRRGIIGAVEGMPQEVSPESAHYQRVIDHLRAEAAAEEAAKARQEAPSPMSAAQLLARAIYGDQGASPALPLNGAALLQRALGGLGGQGTINGGQQP